MHFKELNRGELIAVVGSAMLVVSLFLHWWNLGNASATLGPCKGPHTGCTVWHGLPVLAYLLLAGAVAPVVLAWIIIRGHALSWPRGEMTAVVALIVLTEVLFVGLIDKPGNPRGEIHITYGWFLGLAAGLCMLAGAIFRTAEASAARKPPGVF